MLLTALSQRTEGGGSPRKVALRRTRSPHMAVVSQGPRSSVAGHEGPPSSARWVPHVTVVGGKLGEHTLAVQITGPISLGRTSCTCRMLQSSSVVTYHNRGREDRTEFSQLDD